MASLVDQIFAQAQLGTAVSPDANPFATGVQLGQNQQRISLAERQLASEVAMQPLKQTLMLQDAQMNAAKLEDFLATRQIEATARTKMAELKSSLSKALTEAGPEDAQREFALFGLNNPAVLTDPGYQQMGKQLDAMRREADLAEYRLATADARMKAAEAAEARAEAARSQTETAQTRLQLDQERERRLREKLEFDIQKFGADVPPEKLAIFRERAKAIGDDPSLFANPALREQKLKDLAAELGFGTKTPAAPSTGGFKVKVIKP